MYTSKQKFFKLICSATLIMLLLYSCSNVPITGRRQLLLVSNQEVLSLSQQQYNEFKRSATIATNNTWAPMVERVGRRIAQAVTIYMQQAGLSEELNGYSWEFNLIDSKDVNAFCMPGGKIVVYTGILPITKDETGLAVVLGHEVAHAIAKHANERISRQLVSNFGGAALSTVLATQGASGTAQLLAGTLYGIGTQYGSTLPHSRRQELEADRLGLIFMSMAGYNPQEAIPFWQRMANNKGQTTAEFMSTHPSDQTRIKEIQKYLPEAMKYYQSQNRRTTMPTRF